MIAPVFVDANVLVYRYDARDAAKQAAADAWLKHLWTTRAGRLSFQVLHEFYVNTTRLVDQALAPEEARTVVRALLSWSPRVADATTLEGACDIQDRFRLSWWDALIVSAARAESCRFLLTEDLQHGQQLDGVKVVSPFAVAPGELEGA